MVAAVFEEAPSVPYGNRRDRCPQRFDRGFAGSGLGLSQGALDFRESFLDRSKPGEYGGRKSSWQPRPSISFLALSLL